MDLIKLKQRAILIPTPGQPEQEYLADHLYKQKMFYSKSQKDFNLVKSIEDASQFEYRIPDADMYLYKKVTIDFIEKICS